MRAAAENMVLEQSPVASERGQLRAYQYPLKTTSSYCLENGKARYASAIARAPALTKLQIAGET
jgi:hypothetical protein